MKPSGRRAVTVEGLAIAHNLKTLREFAGLTRHDVGALLNVTHQQIQKYETGTNRLPVQALPILCDAFGVPSEAFFHGALQGVEQDNDLQNIQMCFARVRSPEMRRKILQVVDILST